MKLRPCDFQTRGFSMNERNKMYVLGWCWSWNLIKFDFVAVKFIATYYPPNHAKSSIKKSLQYHSSSSYQKHGFQFSSVMVTCVVSIIGSYSLEYACIIVYKALNRFVARINVMWALKAISVLSKNNMLKNGWWTFHHMLHANFVQHMPCYLRIFRIWNTVQHNIIWLLAVSM